MKAKMKIKAALYGLMLGLLVLPVSAFAGLLYGHGNFDQTLYEIDTVAQTVTPVGTDFNRQVGPEIQLSPDGSTVYFSRVCDPALDFIDAITGLNTDTLNLTNAPENTATALEFVGLTLYGSFHECGPETGAGILGTIDLGTGVVTTIGSMAVMNAPAGGLLYMDGTMYATGSADSVLSDLYTVDLTTGAATLVANITLNGVHQYAATALAAADGKAYTLLQRQPGNFLYSIDLNTGALTQEFALGVRMNALTSPPLPPFDPFVINEAKIKFDNNPSKEEFDVKGEFTLDQDSDGIDPTNEDVKVRVGTSSITIPAGSFVEDDGKFEYEGTIDGVDVEMEIEEANLDDFKFRVAAMGVDLTSTANPLDITLTIGNEAGMANMRLEGELAFELEDDYDDDDD